MKHIAILYLFLAFAIRGVGQCTAVQHNMAGGPLPFHPEWVTAGHGEKMYAEEDMCDYDGWALVWEDNFDLGYLDQSIWGPGYYGVGSLNEGTSLPSPGSNNANYSVSGGILSLTSTYNSDHTSRNYGKTQNAGIESKRKFPSGKVIIKVKMPPISTTNIDQAPLWMRSTLDYTDGTETSCPHHQIANGVKQYYANEMDVELFGNTRSQGTYTLHSGVDDVVNERGYHDGAPGTSCYGGSISDGNWHLVEIEWDMWHVNWSVDGTLVNSLARTYANHWDYFWFLFIPVPYVDYYQEVNECDGPELSGYYHRDWMFPLFANFPIYLSSLSAFGGFIDQSSLPYTTQIDYVKFYRKVKCDKNLVLPPSDLNPTGGFRSAGGIGCDRSGGNQVPPTLDNQTPSIIIAHTITVGQSDGSVPYIFRRDDYDYLTQQNLDLMAIQSVTLMPGFETDFLYQANGPCGTRFVTWQTDDCNPCTTTTGCTPVFNSQALGNNWTIQDAFSASIIDCPPASKKLEIPNPPLRIAPVRSTSSSRAVSSDFSITLYPNPANGVCTVGFNMSAAGDVTITLSDITGRSYGTIDHSWHNAGTSNVPFSTQGYAPGVYLVRFSDGTNTSTQRLTIAQKN